MQIARPLFICYMPQWSNWQSGL